MNGALARSLSDYDVVGLPPVRRVVAAVRRKHSRRTHRQDEKKEPPLHFDTALLEEDWNVLSVETFYGEPREFGRLSELAGERALATATLADALIVIARACDDLARTGRLKLKADRHDGYDGVRLFEDLVWVFEEDGRWRDTLGVSFERACATVGLDASLIRSRMRRRCRLAYIAGERVLGGLEAPTATGDIVSRQGALFVERLPHPRRGPGDGDDGLGVSRRRRRLRGYRSLAGEEAPYLRDTEK